MHKKWGLFSTTLFVLLLLLSSCSSNKGNLSKNDFTDIYIQSIEKHADVINGYVDTYKTGKDHVAKSSDKGLSWISSTKRKISKNPSNNQKTKYLNRYLTDLESEINEYKKNNFDSSISTDKQFNTDETKLKKSLDIDSNKSKALIDSKEKLNQAQRRLRQTNASLEIRLNEKSETFIPSPDDGIFKISGVAFPNKKITLKNISDGTLQQDQNEITTTDSKGNFVFKTFYTNTVDEKCWISYKDSNLKKFKIKITIKANNDFANNHASDSLSTDQTSKNVSNDSSTKHVSKPKATSEDKAALRKAVDYSDTSHLSKQGIYEQLEYDGFPAETAQYAIDNMIGDWNHNALEHAKYYRSDMNMSNTDIYNQLTSSADGFTPDQANYAIQNLDK